MRFASRAAAGVLIATALFAVAGASVASGAPKKSPNAAAKAGWAGSSRIRAA